MLIRLSIKSHEENKLSQMMSSYRGATWSHPPSLRKEWQPPARAQRRRLRRVVEQECRAVVDGPAKTEPAAAQACLAAVGEQAKQSETRQLRQYRPAALSLAQTAQRAQQQQPPQRQTGRRDVLLPWR